MTTETLEWIDPYGVTHDISTDPDETVFWKPGTFGRFMPPVRLTEEEIVGAHGARLRNTRLGVREIALPLMVNATTDTMRAVLRDWLRALNALNGPGTLRAVTPTSDRSIGAIYSGGMEGVEEIDADRFGTDWAAALVRFRCLDPAWYTTSERSQRFTTEAGTPFFPILPLSLSSDFVLGTTIIDHDGDLDTWPRWMIEGPADSVELVNDDTGETLTWEGTLTDTDVLTIDTAPGVKTVRLNDVNAFSGLTAYDLWPLHEGANNVTITVAAATSDTAVTVYWRDAYLAP